MRASVNADDSDSSGREQELEDDVFNFSDDGMAQWVLCPSVPPKRPP